MLFFFLLFQTRFDATTSSEIDFDGYIHNGGNRFHQSAWEWIVCKNLARFMGSKESSYTRPTWIDNRQIRTQTVIHLFSVFTLCVCVWFSFIFTLNDFDEMFTFVNRKKQISFTHSRISQYSYYLEPASPLKSITNTAQLAPSQNKQQQQQLNSATLLTNGTAKSIEENNSNLWTSNTNINGKTSNSRWKMDLFSTNDNNSLFNNHISAPVTNGNRSNGLNNNNNGTSVTNGFNLNGNDHVIWMARWKKKLLKKWFLCFRFQQFQCRK